MIQQIIVFLIVGLAAGYLARLLYRQARGKESDCGCGCTECADASGCDAADNLRHFDS